MDTIVLFALIALAFIILYLTIEGALSGVTNFNYNSDLNVRQNSIEVSAMKDPTSRNFAYGMWVNINKPSRGAFLFYRLSELQVLIDSGELKVKVFDSGNLQNAPISILRDFPLQKWVYLTISVAYNDKNVSILDVYIDGKLIKSIQTRSPIYPRDDKQSRLIFGALDAKMVDFKRWTYALSPQMVMDEYDKSSIKKSLGSYSADISILKSNVMAKRISLF
jgi:hypothetical protein